MITIEFEPPHTESKPCPCCGANSTRLTRFVYKDDDAYAVYYARFTEGHLRGQVSLLISTGEWANDAPPSGRQAFYVQIISDDQNYKFSVRDAADSPWGEVEFFGRALNRDEALAHPRIGDVFHICDHIVAQDRPIIEYFCNGTQGT